MMPKWSELHRFCKRNGWIVKRQSKHTFFEKDGRMIKLSKQVHPDTSEVFKEDDHFQKLINQAYEILNGGIK